jgi:hypothetical protein
MPKVSTSLLSAYADRSNRVLMVFDNPLDDGTFEIGTASLVATDNGIVPVFVHYEEVPGYTSQVYAIFAGQFRDTTYTMTYGALLGLNGAVVSGTVTFSGLPVAQGTQPRDKRLKVDLNFDVTTGGDIALLVGDDFLREQALRILSWTAGELATDPQFGVPYRFQGPANPALLVEYRRLAEKQLRRLPGVVAAKVGLTQTNDMIQIEAALQTNQTSLTVEAQRTLGR